MTRMKKLMAIALILVLVLQGTMLPSVAQAGDGVWSKLGTKATPAEIAIGGTWATDLVVDPNNPKHIIVTNFWPSIKQSWDGGKTWGDVNLYAPQQDNMLTTRIFYVDGIWYFNSWEYIFKTQDWKTFTDIMTGKTSGWKSYDDTIPGYAATSIDDFWTDGKTFYLGMRASDNKKCLFSSIDGGKTWTNLSPAVVQAVGTTYSTLGVDRLLVFKSLLFIRVGLAGQWLVSSDSGLTFKKVIDYGADYAFLDIVGDRLWLTRQKENTIKESSDGIRWNTVNENVLVIRGASWPPYKHFLYDKETDTVFASIKKQIVYSRDMGKTWTDYSEGLPTDSLSIWPRDGILGLGGDTLYLSLGEEVYSRPLPSTAQKQIVILHVGSSVFTVNGVSQNLDSPPVIKNGRTLVPIRAIIEALGGTISWDGTARKATVTLGDSTIELWIGKNTARVNGVTTPIDAQNAKVVPEIINGRTMLPLRFVAENLGCSVVWTDATKTVTITYAP